MRKFTPFKLLGLTIVCIATSISTQAQMLDQIDLSSSPGSANTYVTGLNNSGYACGYYNEGGADTGFIITDRGKVIKILPSSLSATGVKVESINDYGIAVITANSGSGVDIWKAYVDTITEEIANYQIVMGMQSGTVAFDINNKNDISGWFQTTYRFLGVKHDSIVPGGNSAFESAIYSAGINTMAGGINDANQVAGFYIDGINYEAFIYNNLAGTFDVYAWTDKIKPWDINNNGWVAGEFQNGGVWRGFIANTTTGNFSQFTSLASIFSDPNTQSVANAINDHKGVAGSFLNPATGKWTGFLYFPDVDAYRIPEFDFENDTYKMENSDGGSNPVWTNGYWAGTDYVNNDPYANNGVPLLDDNIMATHQLTTIEPNLNPKWKTFAKEFDGAQTGLSTDPNVLNTYQTIIKPKMFDVWYPFVAPAPGFLAGFKGDCYGFTYAALLRHFYDNLFSSWYNIPAGTNISQIPNTDYNAIDALERLLSKQLDPTIEAEESKNISPWSGMYRLKRTFQKGFNESDPRGLTIEFGAGDAHSVLPYKIKTPTTLPFAATAKDTMYLYDSNYPDSTEFLALKLHTVYPSGITYFSTSYSITNFHFRSTGIRFMSNEQYSELNKSTAALTYQPKTSIGLYRASDYVMTHNGSVVAELAGGSYSGDSAVATPLIRLNSGEPAYRHMVDSSESFNITTSNYTDNAMVWIQLNGPRSMGLSRQATAAQTDHSTQRTRLITYGNPDNTTKYLTGFLRENSNDLQQGVNITAKNICADQGDSIVTQTPASYVYNITKVNGTSNCIYDLDIYASYNGEIIEFHSPVEIGPNTSHTIDPYYVGSNGTQIAIIVDNGLDGNADDTLFVAGFPLGIGKVIDKEGIRIYPNPVQDDLNVEFATAGNYNIVITDMVGRTVYQNTLSVSPGRTTLPMGQYPAGMYLIQVSDQKGSVLVKDKIMKQ